MVKLQVIDPRGYRHSPLYFKTMEDCDTFKYVFKDHMCNVPWEQPIEACSFPEMTNLQRHHMEEMSKDIKKYAESNLSWGFSIMEGCEIGLTSEQQAMVLAIQEHTGVSDAIARQKASDRWYAKMYPAASATLMYLTEHQSEQRAMSPYSKLANPSDHSDYEAIHLWTSLVILFGNYSDMPAYGWVDNIPAAISMLRFMTSERKKEESISAYQLFS